ncbi:MAG TPA: DUF1080 domain-containing protein [Blastocatellia bacterium]|nr:DUF1080 domain-containing protein [Blastocatellia bacterium]
MPKKLLTTILLFIICALAASAQAQESAFLGKWDIQGVSPNENVVYWLEVKSNNGALEGWFLNRGGSVYKLPKISIEDGVLVFPASDRPDAPVHRARIEGDSLKGSVKVGNNTIIWVGVRPPKWGNYNANANHKYGKPVALFDGKSLDAFDAQLKNKPLSWSVVDGVMTNDVHGNNLVSKQKFQDFKIQCEYKLEDKSNSGIYLRGRYELQVLDDYGKPVESHGHMALYSRVAPKVNASKPKGEWQEMEAVVVGNRVTVRLNGQLVQDNIVIDGITGGALDAKEGEPGPIMIQGDHEKVWFRKVVVTPITK